MFISDLCGELCRSCEVLFSQASTPRRRFFLSDFDSYPD
jgi:hypothetical protein